jgi:small subunit ribosomal protein S1
MATEQELKKDSPLHKEFQALLDKDFEDRKLIENQVIKAKIVEILNSYIVVDCRGKSEAMISIDEFKGDDLSKLKVGDTIDCFLERIESGRTGEIVLSYDKAKKFKAWDKMVAAYEAKEEINAIIIGKCKGGFIADCSGLPSFLPSSQLDTRPLKKVDFLMGVPIKVMCVRLDRARGNAAVSRRAVLEKNKSAEIIEALKDIKEGDIVQAQVRATTSWGVFLSYNNLDMLLHVSDLDHGRVKQPSDLVTIGQELKVKITKIDTTTNRISASVKALTEDPYKNIEKKYKIGEIYEGEITKILEYGCFVRLESGVEGLVHASEIDHTNRNIKPSKIFSAGDTIKFKIVNIDKDAKRISLSYKATLDNPWDKIKDKVGEKIKIKISNVTDKAFFGELEGTGLNCMCHYKELSWSEDVKELQKYKKNDLIDVKITEIKDDKIRVSVRALDKDPWDWFKDNNKKVGDVITTRIFEVLKTGVKVAIDKDKKITSVIRKTDLAIEAGDSRTDIFSGGEKLDAKIIELDFKIRRIKLSAKAAQLDEQRTLIQKFGEGATKSGATLKGIFEKAIGKKDKKDKKEK